ncbi:MAG: CoA transferase, partial [Alphaproteobacteria bacterium]
FEAFATADGYMVIAAGNDALYAGLAVALGAPSLATDVRFASNDLRRANVEALKAVIESVTTTRSTAHWLDVLATAGIPCGPINDVAQVVADPQVQARSMVVEIEDGAATLRVAGNPIKIDGVPDPVRRPGAPALDQHRAAILAELGLA